MFNKNKNSRSCGFTSLGFTIVETILAITVIGLVIAATAQLTQSSLRVGRNTIDRFIAFHSAEEGLEIVRSVRDSNWLRNKPWNSDLSDGLYVIKDSPGQPWSLLRIDESVAENYDRIIKIKTVDDTLNILSAVTYLYHGKPGEIALEAELTDWKKGPL